MTLAATSILVSTVQASATPTVADTQVSALAARASLSIPATTDNSGPITIWEESWDFDTLNMIRIEGHPDDIVDIEGNLWAGYVILSSGEVWAWGNNRYGALGNGTSANAFGSGKVLNVTDVVSLFPLGSGALAITSDGDVWSWGWSQSGETGQGDAGRYVIHSTPQVISGLPSVAEVVTTGSSVAARTQQGEVWVWGDETGPMAGNAGTLNLSSPTRVAGLSDIVSIALGGWGDQGTLYAVDSNGSVWAVGSGFGGALGDGENSPTALAPVKVPLIDDAVRVVAAGNAGAHAITPDGDIWSWGLSSGLENPEGLSTRWETPFKTDLPDGMVDIITDSYSDTGYAIMSDGTVFSWGDGWWGQNGNGGINPIPWPPVNMDQTTPVQIAGLADVAQLVTGSGTTLAVLNDGTLLGWGANSGMFDGYADGDPASVPTTITSPSGELDVSLISSTDMPWRILASEVTPKPNDPSVLWKGTAGPMTQVDGLLDVHDIVDVEGGFYAGYAIDSSGEVWAWGNNIWASLGDANQGDHYGVSRVPLVSDVVSLSTTNGAALAITADGDVWSWGQTSYGEIGRGIIAQYNNYPSASNYGDNVHYIPGKVYYLPPVSEIVTTPYSVAARTQQGEVWVWGQNAGQWAGYSDARSLSEATQVTGLSGIVSIAIGGETLYAVDSTGSIWAVGDGTQGALGDGEDSPATLVPVQIPLIADAERVVSTGHGAIAIAHDGGLWAWGEGPLLEDPAGYSTTYQTPFKPELPSDIVDVEQHYAIMSDGTVWAWGDGSHGQLGNDTTDSTSFPTQIRGLSDVTRIATNGETTLALLSDGNLLGWGLNVGGLIDPTLGLNVLVPTAMPFPSAVRDITVYGGTFRVLTGGKAPEPPEPIPDPLVIVEAEMRVEVNSSSVSDDEQTITYDLDVFLDDFPEACGACEVHLLDGDYETLGIANITQGGSVNFSGTHTIGGSSMHAPEDVAKFTAYVTLSVEDPPTQYMSQWLPIDLGFRSPPASGSIKVNQLKKSDGKYYYDIEVTTDSLGGNGNEVCGSPSPDALCKIWVALENTDGSLSPNMSVAVDAFGHQTTSISNIAPYGLDAANRLAGTKFVVVIWGQSGSMPSRFLQLGTLDEIPDSSDLPLIIAHGMTGDRDDEIDIENTVRGSVPSLVPDAHVVRTDTTATGSVWTNAKIIENDARKLVEDLGAPAVNVIAHSKGGLDARAAIFRNPDLFYTLGMLSTPNGGSGGADDLCFLSKMGIYLQPQFGLCDSYNDGLFDLQSAYVQGTFNKLVPDDTSKRYFDLAGNCRSGSVKCAAADAAFLRCDYYGGDSTVCVTSAFWLATNYKSLASMNYHNVDAPGGQHVALDPVFDLGHSAMNTDPCPTLRLLAKMYPNTSKDNPYTYSGGPTCLGDYIGLKDPSRVASGDPSAPRLMANVKSSFYTASAAASLTTTEPPSAPAPVFMNRQAMVAGISSPDQPFTMTLDPEGQDTMGVVVYLLEDGAQPAIHVLDAAGNDTGATVTWVDAEDALGVAQAQVLLTGLAGQERTLQIVSAVPQTLGVQTLVTGPTTLATSIAPGAVAGTATVTAELIRASEQTKAGTTITAYFTDASGARQAVPLVMNGYSGEITATLNLPLDPFVPIGIIASGPNLHRYAMTGIALPDGSGQIGVVDGDTLVDLDGDGTPDAVRLPVAVDVTEPGDYTLVLDAVDANGAKASASGSATLEAGAGVITVDMPLDRLITVGTSGPLSLVNGLLVRGLNPQKVAIASDMGTTAAYDTSTMVPTRPVLSWFAASAADTDGDGVDDTATFTGRISVPASGTYELTASFEAPDGTFVDVDDVVDLGAGMNPYTLELPLDPASRGEGTYNLGGVLLTGVDEPSLWAFGHDASLWIGPEPLPNEEPIPLATLEQHGTTITVDGTASSDPDGTIVETAFDFGDGTLVFGTTATHTYAQGGDVQITMWVKDDDGEYGFAEVGTIIEIPDYEFSGFNNPGGRRPVTERATAGQAIPMGFELGQDWGNDIMTEGSPTVQQVSCTTGEAIGEPQSAIGPRGWLPVYNRRTHQYVWIWNTKASWAGTCQELTFDFNDGSSASHTVDFFRWRWNPWWCPPSIHWQTIQSGHSHH
jgi:alpha-tubulin suppressor-like RCC1 family protein